MTLSEEESGRGVALMAERRAWQFWGSADTGHRERRRPSAIVSTEEWLASTAPKSVALGLVPLRASARVKSIRHPDATLT
jgi:hypothetical protein